MKKMTVILGLVLMGSTLFANETPRTKSLLAIQIELVNWGIATGQVTDETKDFFLESIKDMQNPSQAKESAAAAFTRLVYEGIATGQITDETKDFFLNAVNELNKK